jgi:hypothetical protein
MRKNIGKKNKTLVMLFSISIVILFIGTAINPVIATDGGLQEAKVIDGVEEADVDKKEPEKIYEITEAELVDNVEEADVDKKEPETPCICPPGSTPVLKDLDGDGIKECHCVYQPAYVSAELSLVSSEEECSLCAENTEVTAETIADKVAQLDMDLESVISELKSKFSVEDLKLVYDAFNWLKLTVSMSEEDLEMYLNSVDIKELPDEQIKELMVYIKDLKLFMEQKNLISSAQDSTEPVLIADKIPNVEILARLSVGITESTQTTATSTNPGEGDEDNCEDCTSAISSAIAYGLGFSWNYDYSEFEDFDDKVLAFIANFKIAFIAGLVDCVQEIIPHIDEAISTGIANQIDVPKYMWLLRIDRFREGFRACLAGNCDDSDDEEPDTTSNEYASYNAAYQAGYAAGVAAAIQAFNANMQSTVSSLQQNTATASSSSSTSSSSSSSSSSTSSSSSATTGTLGI